MATAVDNQRLGTYSDMSAFAGLRSAAQQDSKAALPTVAKQFESIFTQMMLKSMRDASAAMGGDDIMGSSEANSYRDMLDHQLSVTLSQGKGIGIADMLVRQLGGASASGSDRDNGLFDGVTGSASTADAVSSPSDQNSGLMNSLERMLSSAGRTVGQGASAVANAVGSIDSPQEFVEKFAPHAIEAAKKLGVSVRALLAQAALETGWGKHMPAQGSTASNNMFGIKAGSSWDGKRVNVPTLEYENGVAVRKKDSFRAYDSPSDSFKDYADMVASSPRYAKAVGRGDDIAGFAHALTQGGYATDPSYAQKLTDIANGPVMKQALAALKHIAADL
ncbi:flagellar assembly peptidoglycan hydrolase FlgJ [Luteibacter aegosomatissinici]|uniref:flagellar assembly peptidoglycan hydrolase FlgJ n=1 Tax=Luteibacter aegosomatissinici TaxID=2911539 RepID=UPI001FFC25F1|nr:flagellar assembly peptidoglycan hydrolase FlgJ [Luteibacter aegosomatissinici]UPG93497.1 flagellar assembly peptidoglycan hydrolase FlgJ [Luteibacter aegosomatissinici]